MQLIKFLKIISIKKKIKRKKKVIKFIKINNQVDENLLK